MDKEYKYKVFYIDKASNNLGWQCQSDDINEVMSDAQTLQNKYSGVAKQEIQTIDQAVDDTGIPDYVPETGGKNCNKCGKEMSLIPAGTSKRTGKPYQAFYACPNRCKQ